MLKTFKMGGVHPPENKLSAGAAITAQPLPEVAVVPLSQHIGAPAQAVVAKGDTVKVGTLLAKAGGFVSANIHSPVSGTVQKIDDTFDASGYRRPAVFIKVEGDEWEPGIDRTPDLKSDIALDAKEITAAVAAAGIVGMGGATFPAHVKLSIPEGKKAEILIINAVECEPYLTADHRLMLEKGPEILVGVRILMKALGVARAVVGIENNKPDAIAHMTQLAAGQEGIEIQPLKVKYPQGAEKQLIKAITGREVPSGKLPIDVGAVVQNLGSAFAIYEAIQKNKPLVERVVTVTGKSLARPVNLLARLGTPISALIETAGGLPADTLKVINGGPMMGKALRDLDVPVTKGTSGITIMGPADARRPQARPCIRCARCVAACPMGLEPYLLSTHGDRQMWPEAEAAGAMDCIECGSCSFTCPANRPLLDNIRFAKANVGRIIRSRK